MYYVAKTKAQFSCQLICAFVFTYAKSRFSHDRAHLEVIIASFSVSNIPLDFFYHHLLVLCTLNSKSLDISDAKLSVIYGFSIQVNDDVTDDFQFNDSAVLCLLSLVR